MASGREDEIRQRAYRIWEREGRPDGRDRDHWMRAEREMAAEAPAETPKRAGAAKKAAARARPAAPK